MRHYEPDLRIPQRDGVQVDRVRVAHVEQRRQPELFTNAYAEHAAVHERGGAWMGRQHIQQRCGARILHQAAMHRGKKAQCVDVPAFQCAPGLSGGSGRGRVHHHVAKEALGKLANRRDHRIGVAGNAGNERGLGNAVLIQFVNPGIRQVFGIFVGQAPVQQRVQLV